MINDTFLSEYQGKFKIRIWKFFKVLGNQNWNKEELKKEQMILE